MTRLNTNDYRALFLNDVPLMDMRAPVEFVQGAFPMSESHPLMSDTERQAVGTCYKEQGQEAALNLGHSLVNGELKAARVAEWKAFCEANPTGYLYCFRGGLRSQISQQWLKEAGIDFPYVEGGYKALRRFLIDTIDEAAQLPITIVAGNTGSGKTIMINALNQGIDLERAANHRGSSFGRYVSEQNTQINFENNLAVQLIKAQDKGCQRLVLEDEGRVIGSANVPLSLYQSMQQAEIVKIIDPLDVRLGRLLDDYVVRMQRDFVDQYGEEQGWTLFETYLEHGLRGIHRRLGHERYEEVLAHLRSALSIQRQTGEVDAHLLWLSPLLQEYYDPMYEYQLSNKESRIVYSGTYDEVMAWLQRRA